MNNGIDYNLQATAMAKRKYLFQ